MTLLHQVFKRGAALLELLQSPLLLIASGALLLAALHGLLRALELILEAVNRLRDRRLARSHHGAVPVAGIGGHILDAPLRIGLLRLRHPIAQPRGGARLRGAQTALGLASVVLQAGQIPSQLFFFLGDLFGALLGRAIALLLSLNGLGAAVPQRLIA